MANRDVTTTINGFTVEITHEDNGVNCTVGKGNFTASLAALDATEELENFDTGETRLVGRPTINRIMTYAENLGY